MIDLELPVPRQLFSGLNSSKVCIILTDNNY
jgi:hypothetical protein